MTEYKLMDITCKRELDNAANQYRIVEITYQGNHPDFGELYRIGDMYSFTMDEILHANTDYQINIS